MNNQMEVNTAECWERMGRQSLGIHTQCSYYVKEATPKKTVYSWFHHMLIWNRQNDQDGKLANDQWPWRVLKSTGEYSPEGKGKEQRIFTTVLILFGNVYQLRLKATEPNKYGLKLLKGWAHKAFSLYVHWLKYFESEESWLARYSESQKQSILGLTDDPSTWIA